MLVLWSLLSSVSLSVCLTRFSSWSLSVLSSFRSVSSVWFSLWSLANVLLQYSSSLGLVSASCWTGNELDGSLLACSSDFYRLKVFKMISLLNVVCYWLIMVSLWFKTAHRALLMFNDLPNKSGFSHDKLITQIY